MASRLKKITATGAVYTGKAYLKSVHLFGGSAASTVKVQDTTAGGGTDVLSLSSIINGGDAWVSGDPDGVFFSLGIYATLAGAGAEASFEYEC